MYSVVMYVKGRRTRLARVQTIEHGQRIANRVRSSLAVRVFVVHE